VIAKPHVDNGVAEIEAVEVEPERIDNSVAFVYHHLTGSIVWCGSTMANRKRSSSAPTKEERLIATKPLRPHVDNGVAEIEAVEVEPERIDNSVAFVYHHQDCSTSVTGSIVWCGSTMANRKRSSSAPTKEERLIATTWHGCPRQSR
jgi:hypothetical protein